ncbi:MAG: isoaspartyl peptidase/L-asparaginase family protein [Alphaproteobacteria bacterium]
MPAQFHPVIIVHGGAGRIRNHELTPKLDGCRAAALMGWNVLQRGGSALDAAEAAVVALEDNPLFNAGIGSTLNALGEVEMDAAIMDGATLRVGAVAAVQGIKNPITLARRVMEDGRHVMLVGGGAAMFARRIGFPECDPQTLIVEAERKRWQEKHGTVGCVTLDQNGKMAVATSTGGIFNKLPGRVGDSPLPGCGTYADELGGVSCTGSGEDIARIVLAKSALAFLQTVGDPQAAAHQAIRLLAEKTEGAGGLIMIDRNGRIGYARNTERMPVCLITGAGTVKLDS